MLSPVRVTIDPASYQQAKQMLEGVKDGLAVALQGAISETLTTARARIARKVGEVINLRVGDIKRQIKVKRPSYKKLSGSITISRKAVPLWQYMSARQKKSGKVPVAVKVRKGKDLPKYQINRQKAFVGTGLNTPYLGIFERVGDKRVMKKGRYAAGGDTQRKGRRKKYKTILREPIRRLWGPTVVGVFAFSKGEGSADRMVAAEVADMQTDLQKNIKSQIAYVLSPHFKGMRRGGGPRR